MRINAERLEAILRGVRYRVNPYVAAEQELPDAARKAIVAALIPALRELLWEPERD